MASDPQQGVPADSQSTLSPALRNGVSLWLCVHLFCVFVALSSNVARSQLQSRLLQVLSPYTLLLNFDLNFVPYHLTHAAVGDVDHRLEILPEGADADDAEAWIVLPDAGWRGGERYKRYQRLAATGSFLAELTRDEMVAQIVVGAAQVAINDRQIKPAKVRLRRHRLQGRDVFTRGSREERDPNYEGYFQTVYTASIIVTADGSVLAVKSADETQTARPDEQQSQDD